MNNFAAEYRSLLASNPEPPSGLHGDGIVMALFERGDNAHASCIVTINILRDLLNWQGAIQLWHVGDAPKLCRNYDVEFINATEMVKKHPGHIRSWCLKSYAIEHSGLARVMWLDWDAYACRNPAPIFDQLQDVDYYYWSNGRHWDDIANHKLIQAITSNPEPHSIQGGVYFLNCATPGGWKMLRLQRCWDKWERETWGQNYDQDGWLLACTTGQFKYVNNDDNPWVWPAWVSYFEGKPYFVHRCGDKLWSNKLARFNRGVPLDEIVERLYVRALGSKYLDLSKPAKTAETRSERCRRVRAARGL